MPTTQEDRIDQTISFAKQELALDEVPDRTRNTLADCIRDLNYLQNEVARIYTYEAVFKRCLTRYESLERHFWALVALAGIAGMALGAVL